MHETLGNTPPPKHNVVQMRDQELFEKGIACLEKGDAADGIAYLEETLRLNPNHLNAIGHLAWACLTNSKVPRAIELYQELVRREPGGAEPNYRLVQARMARDGYNKADLAKMADLAERGGMGAASWHELADLAEAASDKSSRDKMLQRGLRLFPEDPRLIDANRKLHDERRRSRVRAIGQSLGLAHALRWLLGFRIVRNALREFSCSPAEALAANLNQFYVAGSVQTSFSHGPAEMSPSRFAEHMAKCDCGWFRWFSEHSPQRNSAGGLTLLDVGCGPGYTGQHFTSWGYKVTALSGNEGELAECEKRGMQTLQCDMHAVPRPSASFDAVLASHVLEHSPAPLLQLWEIKRLLKRDGLLYVALPLPIEGQARMDFPELYDSATDSYRVKYDSAGQIVPLEIAYYSYGMNEHFFVLTYWQWMWIFRQAGFEHVASAIELPGGKIQEPEAALAEINHRPIACNQLFVLRTGAK